MFKLAFTTYSLAKNLTFDESIQLAKDSGCAGIDFRTGSGYAHGVELSLTPKERKDVRRKLEDNYLEISSINSGYMFDSPDKKERARNVELSKRECELAYELGCSRIRVFGNNILVDDAQECVAYVSEAIGEVADFAAPLGITVMLEMHFQFNYWGYAPVAVRMANRENLGILYNCDQRDLVGGSCLETFRRVKPLVRHVHMKDLHRPYPYTELLEELVRMEFDGYLSAELDDTSDPTRVMTLHNIAVRAMTEVARRNVKIRA